MPCATTIIFMVAADFDAYCAAQRVGGRALAAIREAWWRSAILNTARVGWFSSDRTIAEYAAGHLGRAGAPGAGETLP